MSKLTPLETFSTVEAHGVACSILGTNARINAVFAFSRPQTLILSRSRWIWLNRSFLDALADALAYYAARMAGDMPSA